MSDQSTASLVLVDHGSRRPDAQGHLEAVGLRVAERRPGWRVYHAHMDVGEPDLPTTLARCVEDGARQIIVHPFFLNTGFHVQETIPSILDGARAAHPGVEITLSAHLGLHDGLIDAVVDRVGEVLGEAGD